MNLATRQGACALSTARGTYGARYKTSCQQAVMPTFLKVLPMLKNYVWW